MLVHSFTRVSMIPCQVLGSAECLSLGIPQGSDGGRCSSHSANTFLSKSVRHCTRRRDPKPGFWELSAQWGQPDSTVEGRVLRAGRRCAHHACGLTDVYSELVESLVETVQEPAVLGREHGRPQRVSEDLYFMEEETGAQRVIFQGPG